MRHLRAILDAVEEGRPISRETLRAANREYVELIEGQDHRKAKSLRLHRDIRHARKLGATRQQILDRFNISKSTYHEAMSEDRRTELDLDSDSSLSHMESQCPKSTLMKSCAASKP